MSSCCCKIVLFVFIIIHEKPQHPQFWVITRIFSRIIICFLQYSLFFKINMLTVCNRTQVEVKGVSECILLVSAYCWSWSFNGICWQIQQIYQIASAVYFKSRKPNCTNGDKLSVVVWAGIIEIPGARAWCWKIDHQDSISKWKQAEIADALDDTEATGGIYLSTAQRTAAPACTLQHHSALLGRGVHFMHTDCCWIYVTCC